MKVGHNLKESCQVSAIVTVVLKLMIALCLLQWHHIAGMIISNLILITIIILQVCLMSQSWDNVTEHHYANSML